MFFIIIYGKVNFLKKIFVAGLMIINNFFKVYYYHQRCGIIIIIKKIHKKGDDLYDERVSNGGNSYTSRYSYI